MCRGQRWALPEDKRLIFPRDLVLKTIAEARRDIVLCGQDPAHDLDLSGARVHMSSGGGAPGVFDLDDGHYRDGSLKDLYDAARICDAMENIHHFSRSIVAQDIEDNALMDINTAYACLMGTSKHVSVSVTEPKTVEALAALCYQLAGSEAAFRARPFLTVMVCHVVPPMRFAEEACETLEAAILAGFPVQLFRRGKRARPAPRQLLGRSFRPWQRHWQDLSLRGSLIAMFVRSLHPSPWLQTFEPAPCVEVAVNKRS